MILQNSWEICQITTLPWKCITEYVNGLCITTVSWHIQSGGCATMKSASSWNLALSPRIDGNHGKCRISLNLGISMKVPVSMIRIPLPFSLFLHSGRGIPKCVNMKNENIESWKLWCCHKILISMKIMKVIGIICSNLMRFIMIPASELTVPRID